MTSASDFLVDRVELRFLQRPAREQGLDYGMVLPTQLRHPFFSIWTGETLNKTLNRFEKTLDTERGEEMEWDWLKDWEGGSVEESCRKLGFLIFGPLSCGGKKERGFWGFNNGTDVIWWIERFGVNGEGGWRANGLEDNGDGTELESPFATWGPPECRSTIS